MIVIRYGIIDEVVKTALEEDVNVIGLSYYSAGWEYEVPRMLTLLKEKDMKPLVIVGGIINEEEKAKLMEWGVKDVFTPGRPVQDVIDCIVSNVTKESPSNPYHPRQYI